MLWTAGYVTVIDLKNLCCVLNHEAVWIDEVGENVVSGAVPSHTPADGVAVIDHPSGASHNRIVAGHHECNVVEAVDPRICQHNSVMIAVATQEGHHFGTIGQAEAERSFKEASGCVHIDAVQVDVGKTKREILACTGRSVHCVAADKAKHVAFWSFHRSRPAAVRAVVRCQGAQDLTSRSLNG